MRARRLVIRSATLSESPAAAAALPAHDGNVEAASKSPGVRTSGSRHLQRVPAFREPARFRRPGPRCGLGCHITGTRLRRAALHRYSVPAAECSFMQHGNLAAESLILAMAVIGDPWKMALPPPRKSCQVPPQSVRTLQKGPRSPIHQ